MRRVLFLFALAAALVFACAGVVLAEQSGSNSSKSSSKAGEVVPGEILVKFNEDISEADKDAKVKEKGDKVKEEITGLGVTVVSVGSGKEKAKVDEYKADKNNVEYAEPNTVYQADQISADAMPNDPQVGNQWGFDNTGQNGGTAGADIRAFSAWDVNHADQTVPVAVLDTGIRSTHEDLQNKLTLSKNFSSSTNGTDDKQGHGTHVAGTIAANTGNSLGVAGTCGDWKNCSLLNGKVLNDSGSGSDATVANGILWASGCDVADGQPCGQPRAKVINMSLGGGGSITLQNAVNKAWGNGVVLVAAAGNQSSTSSHYPAAYNNVIAVGATDNKDQKASYSNYGSWVDVAAPGSSILSTVIDDPNTTTTTEKYGTKSGTSMATPHVSGTAALVWFNAASGATNQQIRDKIESTADRISGTGTYWTKGRINACTALNGGTSCDGPPPDETEPETTIDSGPSGTVTSGTATFTFSANESGSRFECSRDGSAWASCTSPKQYTSLPNGSHTFKFRATDSAGNIDSTPASRTWTINDTTPPDTTITSGPPEGGTTGSTTPSFGFSSSEEGSNFECSLDASAWGSCSSPKAYSGLSSGPHTFKVRAKDGAGNTDQSPAMRTWTIDTTLPVNKTCASGNNSTNPCKGTNGVDNITGTFSADYILGLAGDDKIDGGYGDDQIWGGDGIDTIYGGYNSDTIYGDEGNDTIKGGYNRDTIYGGGGEDTISGENDPDTIYAVDGRIDTIDCGSGDDTVTADPEDNVAANCESVTRKRP
jgi:thermitase